MFILYFIIKCCLSETIRKKVEKTLDPHIQTGDTNLFYFCLFVMKIKTSKKTSMFFSKIRYIDPIDVQNNLPIKLILRFENVI